MDDELFYATSIGKILANFQALEFVIRVFLLEIESINSSISLNLDSLHNNDRTPINAMTNNDKLEQLINKFNNQVKRAYPSFNIEKNIVDLRNTIAHGRISRRRLGFPLLLLNFGKYRSKEATVIAAEEVNRIWLNNQINRTSNEVTKVINVGQSMGLRSFPRE